MKEAITLFPYQETGAAWLVTKKVALLADEMGLGKSAQAIRASDCVQATRVLVVCPAIARVNWHREFAKFSDKKREFLVVKKKLKSWPHSHSIITSYESAMEVVDSGEFDVLIIDEAHYLKSKDAKRTAAIFGKNGLVRRAKRTWALTGTPAPNHPGELWPLLYTFGATKLTYSQFVHHFCDVFQGTYGMQITGANQAHIPELRQLMSPLILRRKKDDVMKELPPIYFADHVVEAGPVDIEVEGSFVQYCFPQDRRDELKEKLRREQAMVDAVIEVNPRSTMDAIKSMEALANSVSTLRRYTGLQKVQGVADIIASELEANAYDKIVIFAIHRDVIEGLRVRLKSFGPVALYGGYTADKQQSNIDRFQNRASCRVLIANIQCAGTAVTLTASHQVAFIEQDWVPGNNAQAVMRCHRIGQTRPVYVRFFGLADSVDERIAKVLKRKTKDLTAIFDDTALTNANHDYKKSSLEKQTDGESTNLSIEELLS